MSSKHSTVPIPPPTTIIAYYDINGTTANHRMLAVSFVIVASIFGLPFYTLHTQC